MTPRTTQRAPEPLVLVESGWDKAVYIAATGAPSLRALLYPDGRIGIEHECSPLVDGTRRITAPKLRLGEVTPRHNIVSMEPLTVEPSVSCPDCGLHGFIREGRWVTA